ncbi:T9SS type B sorting domain-containing protein [Winogradskyella psychrotolerans]|uniref:T9SS type B sorting domain-containing protein n=1 Tax=Winogradskyella psychrotolerans TaxID=1344585 RepID=UPI001C06B5C7|nr:T9SS type B sorting domain-containing protein [Winogradskyella psychrotolerans]MBU2929014.1 T9SS type B sorting domain-containing protein [Winogradskyella psychrotolerans]
MRKLTLVILLLFISITAMAQCPTGDVSLNNQTAVINYLANYGSCEIIDGDLFIGNAVDISGLTAIRRIEGSLIINYSEITSLSNFSNLEYIGGDFQINYSHLIETIDGINNLEIVQGKLEILGNNGLETISGFNALENVVGRFTLKGNNNLITISAFDNLISVGEWFTISNNDALLYISSFNSLLEVGLNTPTEGNFLITGNNSLININGFNTLETIGWDFHIGSNALVSVQGFNNLKTVTRYFNIAGDLSEASPNLVSIPLFNALELIGAGFKIVNSGITQLSGFNSLITIGSIIPSSGWFILTDNNNLTTIDGLNNLVHIYGVVQIYLNNSLESIIGLHSLTTIDGLLDISLNPSLTSLNGLEALAQVADSAYANSYGLYITNNSALTNCSAICNLLLSDGITGLVDISGNPSECSSREEVEENCTTTEPTACTTLTMPLDEAINVPVGTSFSWNPVPGATGYRINMGTDSIFFGEFDAGFNLSFDLWFELPGETLIYVRIIPYNSYGDQQCTYETFTTGIGTLIPNCTQLSTPLNEATEITVNTEISWNAVADATGYIINIGTTSGGNDIVNNLDVGNITTYNPTVDFPENTRIFVTLIPYNAGGQASDCSEESFTTQIIPTLPNCTTLTLPLDGATDVSVSTNLSWNEIPNATGYNITITTGIITLDTVSLNDVLEYDMPFNLPENAEISVEITPFNDLGEALACSPESFITTGSTSTIPNCSALTTPLNLATNVSVTTNLSWMSVPEAEGYILTIGTTPEGTDILDTTDLGNITTYNPSSVLPEQADIYVTIIPYNQVGEASGCTEEHFTTETILVRPNCTSLISPSHGAEEIVLNTTLVWNTVMDASGYILNIGTSSGSTDILDAEDVGLTTNYNLPSDLPADTVIYVTIVSYNENGEALNCVEEQFKTEQKTYKVPAFFTPNNDDKNDIWIIEDPEYLIETLWIFNRYGKLLKEVKGPYYFWDGYYNSHLQPVNDYWYVLKLRSGGNDKGHFTLKR